MGISLPNRISADEGIFEFNGIAQIQQCIVFSLFCSHFCIVFLIVRTCLSMDLFDWGYLGDDVAC